MSEWLRYKSELGQAYKPTGLKALFAKIQKETDKSGEDAVIAAISNAIANGWKGIYFDSKPKSNDAPNDGYDYSQFEHIAR